MPIIPAKRIVVPYDFSDESFRAVEKALAMTASPANISIVHVLPDVAHQYPYGAWTQVEDQERLEVARRAVSKEFEDTRFHGVQIELTFGDPGQAIVACAEELGAELIVIPSRGTRGLKRLLLGSVAERVVRLAHCPVLVLRD